MLLPFAELEFTHGLGPAAGRYVVRPPGQGPPPATPPAAGGLAATLPPGSADVLLVRVDGTPGGRRPLLRRNRVRTAEAGSGADDVPLYVVSLLFATQAYPDRRAADAQLAGWRADPAGAWALADETLAVLNRAIRAYRAAAADPYVLEVTRGDARAIRVGFGGEGLVRGEWDDAIALPAARGPRLPREVQLRPTEIVADVLAGRRDVLDGEDLLLRAVLDIEQGRPDVAARQLELAVELLQAAPDGVASRLAALGGRPQAVRARLGDPGAREAALGELNALATEVGQAIDAWRTG